MLFRSAICLLLQRSLQCIERLPGRFHTGMMVSSVQGGGELMDNTSSFNVDEGVAKIRVPYATYTGE